MGLRGWRPRARALGAGGVKMIDLRKLTVVALLAAGCAGATMTPEQERQLMLSRREDLTEEQRKKDLANFHDTQLDRAVDALKGVLVFQSRKPQ